MKVFRSFLCLAAAASSVVAVEDIAILEDTPEARLIKDHDPIAEATYHESDPVVAVSSLVIDTQWVAYYVVFPAAGNSSG